MRTYTLKCDAAKCDAIIEQVSGGVPDGWQEFTPVQLTGTYRRPFQLCPTHVPILRPEAYQ